MNKNVYGKFPTNRTLDGKSLKFYPSNFRTRIFIFATFIQYGAGIIIQGKKSGIQIGKKEVKLPLSLC